MKKFKVFYIYMVEVATKTEALRVVEESRKSADPAQYLSAHFAKEEEAQTFLSQVRRQVLGK